MAKEKKLLTEEEKQNIKDRLEERFGFQGEDWDVLFATIRGVEKAYAIISPSKRVWNHYRDQQNNPKKKATELEFNLTIDCLAQDVEGCVALEEYKTDLEFKPALQSVVAGKIAELITSGFEISKKD
jgi:hypothetical protein